MHSSTRRGGAFAGVLISVLLVVEIVVGGLVLAGLYVARNVRVTQQDVHGKQTTVETPLGTLRVRERTRLDPRQLGIPVYPGANRVDDNKVASFEFDSGDTHKALNIACAEFTSPDSLDKVREFYRGELPHWMYTEKEHGGWQFEFKNGGYRKIIALNERDGQTHIGLASIGEPAAN